MKLLEIGELIERRRKMLGLQQATLATMSGSNTRTIHQIENGSGNPSFNTLRKVLEVVGMEMSLIPMKVQQGIVYCNDTPAGIIKKTYAEEYTFEYYADYLADPNSKAISLTMPKTQQKYTSNYLFPFFSGLLSEGINRIMKCRMLKIDEEDEFTLLLKTAGEDTIGAITVKEIFQT